MSDTATGGAAHHQTDDAISHEACLFLLLFFLCAYFTFFLKKYIAGIEILSGFRQELYEYVNLDSCDIAVTKFTRPHSTAVHRAVSTSRAGTSYECMDLGYLFMVA